MGLPTAAPNTDLSCPVSEKDLGSLPGQVPGKLPHDSGLLSACPILSWLVFAQWLGGRHRKKPQPGGPKMFPMGPVIAGRWLSEQGLHAALVFPEPLPQAGPFVTIRQWVAHPETTGGLLQKMFFKWNSRTWAHFISFSLLDSPWDLVEHRERLLPGNSGPHQPCKSFRSTPSLSFHHPMTSLF